MRSKDNVKDTSVDEQKTSNRGKSRSSKRTSKKKGYTKDYGDDRKEKYNKGKSDTKVTLNDPSWTFPNPEIAEQVSQLSFQNFQGYGSVNGYKVPSILSIGLVPCPGITSPARRHAGGIYCDAGSSSSVIAPSDIDQGRTGANVAATKLYSLLSSFTGRTSNYQPNDVLQMLLAIASFTEVSEHVRRIFGVSLTFNPRNRALAKDLIASMGYEPDDFFANMSVYRMRFNAIIARINQVPLLDNIGFIKKSRDIYQYLYTDANTNMAQYFYYYPAAAWVLDESSYTGGTALVTSNLFGSSGLYPVQTSLHKVSETLNLMNSMVDALLTSTTLNLIYADLLNMSNKIKTPTWTFDYLAENYTVLPIYNENACLQLHNLDIVGRPMEFSDLSVTGDSNGLWNGYTNSNNVMSDPNTGNIIYNPVFYTYGIAYSARKIVDMPTDNPDVKMRIEALRYSAIRSGFTVQNGSNYYWVSPAIPDHYAIRATLFDVITYTSPANISSGSFVDLNSNVKSTTAWANANHAAFRLRSTQIHCAPLMLEMDTYATDTESVVGDVEYYTTIDYEYLKRVNDFAYQFLFDFRNS